MATSPTCEIKRMLILNPRRLFSLFLFSVLSIASALAQPVWTAGPTFTTHPITVDATFTLNQNSKVYYVAYPYNYGTVFTSAAVKNLVIFGGGGICDRGTFIYSTPGVPATITISNFPANTQVTIYIVAESNPGGVLQLAPVKVTPVTLPCPKIDMLTGFSQPVVCINKTAIATFQVVLLDPPSSGIMKGTQWTISWGDGSPITNFTSAADYEIPPLALRQHQYTTATTCNYVFSSSVRNPCGETRAVQYVAVVHGRDIPSDGDGVLNIVNSATGSSVIRICEGTQSIITIRDNSTWNCQNPVLPGGLLAVPNTDPRNIEWLYGRDPVGGIFNTITGLVSIASMGNAPQASGRISPSPYGPSSLSQAITIPATCRAGEYFRVYLKNWNKCNWNDPDYVNTYVDILVVSAPPAPTAPSRTVCPYDDKTLTVTSVPVGTFNWYSDAALTNLLGTGPTYVPTQAIPGSYNFYVTDKQLTGQQCQSPATTVTLTINQVPGTPSLSAPAKNDICYGVEPPESYVITASSPASPAVTRYQWYKDGVLLPGRISDTIYITKPNETGSYRAVAVGAAPTYCFSAQSIAQYVTVHTLLNVTQPVDQVICENQNAVFTATTTEAIANWQWEVSYNNKLSFTTVSNSAPYSGFNTNTLTITTPPTSYNGYWYRVEMKTPNGQGGCRFKSAAALLTVNGLPTANAGAPIIRCSTTPLAAIYMTGATQGGTASSIVWSGGAGLGTWTQNATNPALAYFTPTVTSGSFTATLTVTGTAACGGVVATSTRTISWSQTPVVDAGANISRCDLTPLAIINMTGATVTGTYSALSWSGGAGLGTWTQNANPALAYFTPSVSSGSFTATLSVTGSAACAGTNPTDTRIITWGQTPIVEAGPAFSRCDESPLASIVMTGASSTGTFINQTWSGGGALGTWTQNANPALAFFTPNAASTSGSFTATLSLTGTGACTGTNVSDTRTIQWSWAATVNAGIDQRICALGTVPLAGTIGGGATSATWSGGTGTYNPNNTTLNAIYTPSPAERAAHAVTLTLTTNDPAGICPAVSDNMAIEIGTVISGGAVTSSGNGCSGIAPSWLSINITGGAPPYTVYYKLNGGVTKTIPGYVSGSAFNLGILPVGSYLYEILRITDICGNDLTLNPILTEGFTIYQQPVANAGSDAGRCGSLAVNLNAIPSVGTGTWSVVSGPGTIAFTPNVNSAAVTATASTYGAYVVRWTEINGGICISSSDKTVSFERIAAAGTAQNLCGTPVATLAGNTPAAGTGTWTKVSGPGTVTFSPNANTPGATATVSAYGTYVLKWTIANSVFCSTDDNVTITFERAANSGATQHLCGTFAATLAGNAPAVGTGTWSLVSGPGTVAFTPNINTATATATVSQYGTYVFNWRIDNGAFCTSNQNVSVTYNPSGQVVQPASQVLCNGNNTTAITFSTTNIGGTTSYSWTNTQPSIGLAASGTGDIPIFQAVNMGTAPVVASIVVTPTYSDGVVNCTGPTKTFTITVNPTAQVNQPASQVACNNSPTTAINFTTANTVGTTTYAWSNSDPSINLAASGTGNIPSFTATNTGTAPVTATITVVPTFTNGSVSCTGSSKTFTITVNPSGQVIQPSSLALCNTGTGTVSFATLNTLGTTTYSWTNSNTAIGLAAIGNGDISFTATNSGTAPITGTIIVTPTYSYGGRSCAGPTKTFNIIVNPTGQVNQPASPVICNGATGSMVFTTLNTVGTTSYSWTNNNTAIGLGASGTGNISFLALNPGTTAISATITVTPTFNFGSTDCPGSSKTFSFTVNPSPNMTSSLTPPDQCSNTLFSYTPSASVTGTTFNWNRAVIAGITPAGPTSGTNNPNETLRNRTNIPIGVTYQYTLAANGCSNTQNVIVNIKPEPVILPGQTSQTWCSGNALNYPVTLVNFINPVDNVTFTWPAPVLSPVNPNFTGGTARSSASSANISDLFINTTGASGTATYTVTPYKDGCAGTPETVVVTVRSQPVLNPGLGRTVCSNTAIGLTLSGAAGSVSIDSYNISNVTLDAGLSAAPGNATIANSSAPAGYLFNDKYINITGVDKNVTYRVQPFHGPDCYGDPVDIVVTIHPQPYIIPAQTKSVCSGIAIGKEILLSPPNIPAGTIFNWPVPVLSDFSVQGSAGVNVAADPAGTIHINDQIYNYSGSPITATYNVTPTISSTGCVGTTIPVIITINPEPVPKPISGRDKICVNEKSLVYNVATAGGSTFHWTVSPAIGTKTFDFNTNAIIIDAAAAPGTGNITLYETNSYGCDGDLSTLPVQVYTQAVPENITGPATICSNSTHTYSVTSRAGSVYSWTIPGGAAIIGDPSAASITVVFGNVGGSIQVKETNIAGCITNHNPLTVTVRPLPTAIINGGGIICDGGSGSLFVDFTGTGPYSFTYAINGVSQPPVNTSLDPYTLNVTQAGTYTIVNVTDATGCNNTGFGSAFVTYFPKPTGIISGGATLCGGASTTLTLTFTGMAPYTFTYTDGTTPLTVPNYPGAVYTISVSPSVTSTYTITSLTDGNGCAGTISGSATVTINPPPVLTLAGTNLTCNNDNTGAVNLTVTGNSPFGFTWTGPGGYGANTEDISGLRAGTYTVSVMDTRGCTATGSVTLTQPGPVDATLASTNIFCFGSHEGTITVSAPSGGSGSYEYTINGGTSWQASGSFTGLDPGTYDVRIRDVLAPVCNKILNGALVLTGPAVLNATFTATDINCYNSNNGSIVISGATGGFGTYEYTVHGTTGWQGSGNFTNLSPGSYDVRIRDAAHNTCVVTLNGAVTIAQPTELTATVTSTNVTCFGSTDGSITIAGPAGGHGTFEYSINGGGSWQASGAYNSLAPGTYNVQIRDAAFPTCYRILDGMRVITQPAVLRATVASTMISCFGANDGIINITGATGGTGTYEYTVHGTSGWQASGLFTGLVPGSYDVRIRDAAHTSCEIILNNGLQITEPAALSALIVKTDISCFGAGDGNITITNSQGGYLTFEYSINGGLAWQSSNVFPGLTEGTYDVWMRDKVRTTCTKQLDPAVVIVEPDALAAVVSSTNVTCFNANDGTITISSPTGGFGTYQYSINGGTSWQASGNYINLSPGTYEVRIRDAASITCFKILDPGRVITQPTVLSATITKTNITCFSAADGTITINGATGGYGTYEYTINGGASWHASNIFTGLLPGFYNVMIRDAARPTCIITLNGSLNVTEPPVLNAAVAKTNVTCNGANNGTITISAPTGGYGTYEFSINGGSTWQSSGSYINLPPATYNVMIHDAAQPACVITLNPALVITEPAALAATMTYTNIECFGANNGTISITGAAGGSGLYEYSNNGGTSWTGLSLFTNLSPSTYDVRMRDAINTGCILILNSSLAITQPQVLNAAVAKTDITCFGANNGTISVTGATGGYGIFEYTINGGGSWQPSGSYTGLGAGNYNVQIRDAAHPSCIIVLNNSLSITQPAVLNAVITPTMITCNGAHDGIINITAPTGGYGTYEYSIDGGTTWTGTGLFTGLAPAVYDVRIRDAANPLCMIILNNTLSITQPSALNAILNFTNIDCFGANNGTITISNPTGGYGTYDYTIDGGTNWQATGSFTNLIPGTYNVQIRDKAHNACVFILNSALQITQPAILSAAVTYTNITCFGADNGTITISGATGGYGTYQYSIDGGVTWVTSGNFNGLIPGSYNVRIRDAAHISCFTILNPGLLITQPDVLSASVAYTHVTCSGANDGTITISSPLGGYGTYEYTINGGANWFASGNFISLAPGFYNVQIRDAASTGCLIILNGSLRITEPGTLGATVVKNDITCNGANDGRITISLPTGGYGTYEYSIDGGLNWQLSGIFTALIPKSYDVRMRDAAHQGCFLILNPALVITEPGALAASFTSTNITCNGANDGKITITGATGGYGTYQYTINGGTQWFSSGEFVSLIPGTYNVQMRDAANPACRIILNTAVILTQPDALNATVVRTNVTCAGSGDGTITISSPTGGYGLYEYSINGGGSWQNSGNYTGLGPGNYSVRMRDAANIGCVRVLNNSLSITQPAMLNAVVTATMITCNSASDGIINITSPTGGSGSYGYSIDGGANWSASGLFTGRAPATYNVQIRDAVNTGCVITLNSALEITEPSALGATLSSSNITCFGANNGSINISFAEGGYGTYEYSIDGGGTWRTTGVFTGLTPGTYIVEIRDRAHIACVKILDGGLVITEPDLLTGTVASADVTCNGSNDGTITITAPGGGYGTYAYSVNGGASWQPSGSFTNLAPGTYNVRIRDAAHQACERTLNPAVVISQPVVLSATVARTNVTCYGANDGTITISAPTGGYGTFEYSVDGGMTWQGSGNFTLVGPGFYNVQIRDGAHTGCVKILNSSLRITEPPILSANLSSTNVSCNGSHDGAISITGTAGGYGTYAYSINGGATWQPTGVFTGLAPGIYNVQLRDVAQPACVTILNPALSITELPALSATLSQTMVTCNGANDGTITINNQVGGSGAYQYSINGGTFWQGTNVFSNLAPASYNVMMRDASQTSCIFTINSSVVITQAPPLSAVVSGTHVTCFGNADGTITISSPSGGYGTYEYSINGGGSWQSSGNFTALTPASYNIMIRDASHIGCFGVLTNPYIVTQPAFLSATVAKTDITCNGANDGTITISSPLGGYGTYQYSIDGGSNWVGSGNFVNLAPATYDVRMRDAANTNCSVILYPNLVITEPLTLALTSTGNILLDCYNDLDGTGTFFGSGGSLPYSFHVVSNTTGATIAPPGFNSQTFFNAGVGTITVAVTDFNNCFAQATINVTQPALLTPGTIASSQVLCSGDSPAQLTETAPASGGPGVYNYQWQYGSTAAGPFINIAGATGSFYTPPSGATTTMYYRRMITSGLCMPVFSNVVEILVNPRPVAVLSGGETICPSQTSVLKVNMMVGTGPYEIDIENHGTITGYVSGADIVVTPAVTTTYRLLRVRDANGCEILSPSANLIGSAIVTVRALPVITTPPVSITTCEFGIVKFNVEATGSDLTYQWYENTGSGFVPVTDGGIYFGATGSTLNLFGATRLMNGYIYHVIVSGCSSSVTSADATLTVNTVPEILVQPKDTTACMNANAAFSITASGTGVAYQWQVNRGTGFSNISDDANFSGSNTNTLSITNAPAAFNNYIIRVMMLGNCGVPVYSNFAVLRVNIAPVVTLNPVDKKACDGTGPVIFSANGSGIADSLRWQVFSGGVWSDVHDNPIYSGSASQQLTLSTIPVAFNGNQYRLALKAKCTTVYSNPATLTVNPNPVVDFSAIDPIHACGNVPLIINGNPTGGSGAWLSHLWTGDVGPLNNYFIQSPVFTSQIAGTYALNYKVKDSNGCFGNGDVSVIVDAPDASFMADKNLGCTPVSVTFTKDMTGVAKFWWDFGDSSPKDSVNANPVHSFTNVNPSSIEYFDAKLTVQSPGGCRDSYTTSITVYPTIDATFTASPDTVCSGNSITFTTLPGASKYFWNFGDGVSGYYTNTANHIYTNFTGAPVIQTVTLTTTSFYYCTDVKTMNITVMPVPLPQFSAAPVTQIFNPAGNQVVFTNSTNPGTWNWLWRFGDGATSTDENPTHNYTDIGTFNVVMRVSNSNCADSIKHSVSVTPIPPVANFDPIPSGCSPLEININNTSLNTDTPGTTYMWSFGDGGASTSKNPSYIYFTPGIFRVELVVTGPGGVSSYSQVVNAYPSPKANFQVSPTLVFINDEKVRCFNLSQGADSYLWEFGDGDTSKVKEPFHKYMEEGVYDITLWAYIHNVINNETIVCTDKYVLSPGVTVQPAGELRFSTVFTPNTDGEIDMDHLPTGQDVDKFFFPPIREKVTEYKLQVFNRWGVLIFETHDINRPWNGYYHSKLCPQGVYVWYVEGKYANGKPFKKVGDVTLLH